MSDRNDSTPRVWIDNRLPLSVARLVLQHGVNANLLRSWIGQYRKKQSSGLVAKATALPAFVPVVQVSESALACLPGLLAILPNGVRLDLSGVGADTLESVLNHLARLPCSGPTRG